MLIKTEKFSFSEMLRRDLYLCVRLMQNRMETFSTAAKSTKSTATPLLTNGW